MPLGGVVPLVVLRAVGQTPGVVLSEGEESRDVRPGEVRPRREPASGGLVQHRRRSPGAASARSAPGYRTARRPRRSRAALPDGDHRPGGLDRPAHRHSRGGALRLSPVAADAAVSRAPSRACAGDTGAHLLQVRGRLADRLAQAEHRSRAGVLQQGRRRDSASRPRPARASGAPRSRSPAGSSASRWTCGWSGRRTTRSRTAAG